ncbi:MAG: YIP1 family protein [Candidatus Woesearchaeota archaeon]
MNYKDYIKSSFRLYLFDKEEAKKLASKEVSISIGSLIFFILTAFIIAFYMLPELIAPTGDLVFEDFNIAPFLLIAAPVIALFSLMFTFISILWSHLWIKIFGGDKNYKKTIEIFLISYVPFLLIYTVISIFDAILMTFANLISPFFLAGFFISGLITLAVTIYYLAVIAHTISITHNMELSMSVLAGFVSVFIVVLFIGILLLVPLFILRTAFYM